MSYPVQTNNIVVSFTGIELDGETTRVASRIGKFPTEGDGRETHKDWSLDAFTTEEVGFGQVGDIVGGLEVTESSATTWMNHTFL